MHKFPALLFIRQRAELKHGSKYFKVQPRPFGGTSFLADVIISDHKVSQGEALPISTSVTFNEEECDSEKENILQCTSSLGCTKFFLAKLLQQSVRLPVWGLICWSCQESRVKSLPHSVIFQIGGKRRGLMFCYPHPPGQLLPAQTKPVHWVNEFEPGTGRLAGWLAGQLTAKAAGPSGSPPGKMCNPCGHPPLTFWR